MHLRLAAALGLQAGHRSFSSDRQVMRGAWCESPLGDGAASMERLEKGEVAWPYRAGAVIDGAVGSRVACSK